MDFYVGTATGSDSIDTLPRSRAICVLSTYRKLWVLWIRWRFIRAHPCGYFHWPFACAPQTMCDLLPFFILVSALRSFSRRNTFFFGCTSGVIGAPPVALRVGATEDEFVSTALLTASGFVGFGTADVRLVSVVSDVVAGARVELVHTDSPLLAANASDSRESFDICRVSKTQKPIFLDCVRCKSAEWGRT